MPDTFEARAEILKLARLLRREAADLTYLEKVPAADIRALREQVTDALFDEHGAALGRLASASRVLPIGVIATIGQRAFGPILSARITGMLEPARAVEVAERLPVQFLADVAVELDPRRASDVISRIPPQRIAAITRELNRRGEYVMMGRFVGHLSDAAVSAAIAAMDDKALLRVAFVLENKSGLDALLDLIGPRRLDAVIDTAARENLWVEVLGLLRNLEELRRLELGQPAALEPHARRRVAAEVAKLDPVQREALIRDAQAAGLTAEVQVLEQSLEGERL